MFKDNNLPPGVTGFEFQISGEKPPRKAKKARYMFRDPEYPCEAYVEGTPKGTCQSDGHYLCWTCQDRDPEEYRIDETR